MKRSLIKHVGSIGSILLLGAIVLATATAATSLKTGLKVFVIPKNLGNPYFTTADSVKSGGALAALKALKETGKETSGTQATAASQIPAIQAATMGTTGASAGSRDSLARWASTRAGSTGNASHSGPGGAAASVTWREPAIVPAASTPSPSDTASRSVAALAPPWRSVPSSGTRTCQ